MSSPSTYSMSRIYRALGVHSAIQPSYRTESFNPVAIVADFTSTFAPEQIEARALLMQRFDSQAPHDSIDLYLASRTPGGCVIEHFGMVLVAGTWSGADKLYVDVDTSAPWTPAGTLTPLSIGGVGIESVFAYAANQTLGAPRLNVYGQDAIVFPTQRIYVPPGSYFRFGSYPAPAAGHSIYVELMWREIPEQLGAP